MKKMIQALGTGAALALAATALAAPARAEMRLDPEVAQVMNPDGTLPVGAYRGTFNDRRKLDLLVQPYPGREGSSIAILLEGFDRAGIYLIDPFDGSMYTLTPLMVSDDGEIAIPNEDPSLTLTVNGRKDNRPTFTLTNANSSNHFGFQGTAYFEGKDRSPYEWARYEAGQYGIDRGTDRAAMLSTPSGEGTAFGLLDVPRVSAGQYQIREKHPSVYALKQVSVTGVGAAVESYPKKIGVFVKERRGLSFLLIDPCKAEDVTVLRKKK